MTLYEKIHAVLSTETKFLTFRHAQPDLQKLGNYYLALGILTAWLAGIGRYWDHPKAALWQYLGLGSVAYIFILAFVLWALILPLRPQNWNYRSVLIFVGMTSPPAILYAVPVERFFSLDTAQAMNVWFLAIIASWRVALLFKYLKNSAQLSGFTIVVAALLPLTLIVTVLAILNLEHAVFDMMAGMRKENQSVYDGAYAILLFITFFSVLASPLLLISYLVMIVKRQKAFRKKNVQGIGV